MHQTAVPLDRSVHHRAGFLAEDVLGGRRERVRGLRVADGGLGRCRFAVRGTLLVFALIRLVLAPQHLEGIIIDVQSHNATFAGSGSDAETVKSGVGHNGGTLECILAKLSALISPVLESAYLACREAGRGGGHPGGRRGYDRDISRTQPLEPQCIPTRRHTIILLIFFSSLREVMS